MEHSNEIENLSTEDAVMSISESKYGLHSMIIYPDTETFREFYTY